MKAPCTKCGQMFERATRYCKFCDNCWMASRKRGPRKPFHGFKACPICCKLILPAEPRLMISKRLCSSEACQRGKPTTAVGLYHLSCWENYILPKIEKLLVKNKVLAWQTHLKPLDVAV